MSVDFDRSKQRWRVRWRENGVQKTRRFRTRQETVAFDEQETLPEPGKPSSPVPEKSAVGDSIYAYSTSSGIRYRFVFRQSDGTLSSRRGFPSRRAAGVARRKLLESIDRGEVKVARDTFETFWERFVVDKRAYMTAGSHLDLTTHGRKRLVPFFGPHLLARIDDDRVRDWLTSMLELVEAGELAPKTVNNARTYLSWRSTRPPGAGSSLVTRVTVYLRFL